MSKTTKGMTPADVLITVGQWIKEGREIQVRSLEDNKPEWINLSAIVINLYKDMAAEFRVKPSKPLISKDWWDERMIRHSGKDDLAVQLTPEVHAVLEREGLL